ncbi:MULTISPECIES: potassium-transporting ATPase subunit KdpC [Planococcus]|uniref:Potassium-transporting ATPase KdpC subunit n=2 Tax=Planococcus TaxID=1372 RepID=A0ABM5WT60_9BACL|nr:MULTISPECIES: potassium-transporting ATPase subunit KdpC [Planococcus]ALS77440.1 potassium-transporting ATPase subunit C [Planococcus kocurii]AQU80681.1 potassium-transporting ATPase subunit C [Planococcus faecalis]KAA0959181.1 potassium-transporting ATPase subunit KdpC [Planococcus sp. ANT_H30]MDJ0333145.1 potassium-transporting ATPase subunit KdpC [Planococcus sp. S3-L1]OHX55678.1 K+-transporting ATPase subunit C [Planococcus faecalis]
MRGLFEYTKQAMFITCSLFILCGLVYPFAVTGVAQVFFKQQANGNLIQVDDKVVGSKNVGQAFTNPAYFSGRISAINYNVYTKEDTLPDVNGDIAFGGVSSGTYNYGPSNPELEKRIETDIVAFLNANPDVKREQIPADLMTASGSGLDPHISIEAAQIQVSRVAQASGLSIKEINTIVLDNTENKVLGLLGEDKMNVLGSNIAIFQKINEK